VTAAPYIAYTAFGYRQFCTGGGCGLPNHVQVIWRI
jgi:hypothetical protein